MKSLESLDQRTLLWRQPKWAAERYELRAADGLLAELYWTKWFSDQAVAECSQGSWILDRPGCFRDRAVAIDARSGEQAASFAFDWLKDGDLTLADGRTFHWYRTKSFSNAWALVEKDGGVVLEIQIGMRWFKQEALVRLWPGVQKIPGLGLLLCLSLYLGLCIMQDAAGVVAATSAATVG